MLHFRSRKLTAAVLAAALLASGGLVPAAYAAENTAPSADVSTQGGPPAPPPGGFNGGMPGGGGANTMTYDYTGTLSGALTADGQDQTSSGQTIAATETDQNAILAHNGGSLTITDGTLTKTGSDTNGDNCNFYGLNAIGLAVGEDSAIRIADSSLTADSTGSNALFATDKATIYANNDTIVTSASNSRGLDATYGGTIVANKMAISTAGNHCAAVATDRGVGNISVANSTFYTAGSGSPLLYSTGNIQADNVTGTAAGSQIAGMEGLNTILINDSNLTSSVTGKTASDPVANGVIIYQSTSGDAEAATGQKATFQAVDSTLKTAVQDGTMFYLTNTSANVVLKNTTLDFDTASNKLLTVAGNDANNWGTAGKNGASLTFTGLDQTLSGDISVDTISTLDLYLLENTTYTGATEIVDNTDGTAVDAPVTVNLDVSSKWVVTGDSTVTDLHAAKGAQIVDSQGRDVTIVAADGTVLRQGDSDVTLTVTGTMDQIVSLTSANQVQEADIDRYDFDAYYGTQTTYGLNAGASRNENITIQEATGGDEGGGSQPPSMPGQNGGNGQPAMPQRYSDVSTDHWAAGVIDTAARAGFMTGTGQNIFSPEAYFTRAQAAAVLYRLEVSPDAVAPDFTDVDVDAWYASAIAWAQANDIVEGYGDGTFGPDDALTREQFAAILDRYAAYKGADTTSDDTALKDFSDADQVSTWAQEPVAWAAANGILKGTDTGVLSPQGTTTRAQAAAILVRTAQGYGWIKDTLPEGNGQSGQQAAGQTDQNGEPAKPDGDLQPAKPE